MKYSTLSFIISSSILLHACGSSNDIQNHTTDPKPNHNSQHQSNSHNINGNQSSNNSNQATNTSQNSNQQQNNQNDFTPNISSGNAPKPKNNIIISSNNHDDDNDAPIPAPPKIPLDTLTPDKADELVKKAGEKLNAAKISENKAKQEKELAKSEQKKAKKLFDDAVNAVKTAEDSASLEVAKQQLKDAQEALNKATDDFAKGKVKEKKAKEAVEMATLEQELANNAKKFVSDKTTEPEAVLDKIKAEQDAKQAVAEKKELEIKQNLLSKEAEAAKGQAEALGEQNAELKKITADTSATPEAKKEAEAKIKENEDKIAKLNKQNKEKTQAAKDLDNPIAKADVDVKSTDKDLNKAQEGIKYRGVYSSDGKYDPSTSYKNVKKVVAAKPSPDKNTGQPKPDEWMQDWTLFIKDGDKEVKIDTSELKGTLHFAGTRKGPVAHFDKDNNNILVNRGGNYFIQGHIGDKSNSDFFNAGLVTPEENISNLGTVKYANAGVSANDAFLVTKDGVDATRLIAKVSEAEADFGKKIFKGKFKDFAKYSIDVTGQVGSSSDYSGIAEPVEFKADIKGNKFMPAKDLEPNKAKVYGYFYGPQATEAGGLVEHDKFHGTFGVRVKD